MQWPDIIYRWGYDECLETDLHGPSTKADPRCKHHLFHCTNRQGGSEYEIANFLNAMVTLFKFENILETGCEKGHATMAMAAAVQYNGVGQVHTVDNCDIAYKVANENFKQAHVDEDIIYHKQDSVSFARDWRGDPFDFAFFDCAHEARIEAFNILDKKKKLSRIVSFHDVAPYDTDPQSLKYTAALDKIGEKYPSGLINVLSRGFRMYQIAR